MPKFVAFGEIMMRLNPEGYLRFVQEVESLAAGNASGRVQR